MGRLLYELGRVDQKTHIMNERASGKLGKGSFSWAWELDGTVEERERFVSKAWPCTRFSPFVCLMKLHRGVTMDIALQSFSTPNRNITVLDAPGHRDFIPNMISGASQADCALLVVDASSGEFEAGFQRGGQTKEHLLLVRSLGVSQVVIAVNKLDQVIRQDCLFSSLVSNVFRKVDWDRTRYENIVDDLRPFLVQSGFQSSKMKFVPVSALAGANLVNQAKDFTSLMAWYGGPALVDLLGMIIRISSLNRTHRPTNHNLQTGWTRQFVSLIPHFECPSRMYLKDRHPYPQV